MTNQEHSQLSAADSSLIPQAYNQIEVRVFPDQLRIWNDGCIPEGWTVEDLLDQHISRPHNPLIAGAFFRTGDIESWGRGIEKVRKACTEYGTAFPTFRFDPAGMLVVFKGRIPEEETTLNTTQETPVKTQERLVESVGKASEKSSEKIIAAIIHNPFVTIAELSEMSEVTTRSVERNLATLQKSERIRRIGPDKGGHWEVIKNGGAQGHR